MSLVSEVMAKVDAVNPILFDYIDWPMAMNLGINVYTFFIIRMLVDQEKDVNRDNVHVVIQELGVFFRNRMANSLKRL